MLRPIVLVSVVMFAIVCSACADWAQKGVSLTLWDENVDAGQLALSLDDMVAAGVTHVGVNVWWFQDNINSTSIGPDFAGYSASDASVEHVIDAVHARGMSVMLKPLVDLSNDPSHWRGQIVGGADWFTAVGGYADFINHFADLAQRKEAEQFCVGTELDATTSQESHWRDVIAGVRGRYDGELTYAANQGGAAAVTASTIAWWDAVDAFGLDAYYPLTTKNDPTLAELQTAWSAHAARIEAWRDGIDPDKPVLFTEVGYRSWDGTNRYPYSGASKDDTNVDEQEQADCYEAVLSQLWDADLDGDVDLDDFVILKQSFGIGAAWGEGDFDDDGDVDLDDFVLLKQHFGTTAVGEPATLLMLALGGVALRRR